ncbi:uncharacterized protein UTRI_10274 [Ustilago trichophora]|uniref:Uncharacterized protein n=1 Tax=Ustilago trichophora TaxID=86804 RepID=A0A5C3ELL4_9BASI|nr:uncharacterized protein UTRI_10274 [Ustilago trichophora]
MSGTGRRGLEKCAWHEGEHGRTRQTRKREAKMTCQAVARWARNKDVEQGALQNLDARSAMHVRQIPVSWVRMVSAHRAECHSVFDPETYDKCQRARRNTGVYRFSAASRVLHKRGSWLNRCWCPSKVKGGGYCNKIRERFFDRRRTAQELTSCKIEFATAARRAKEKTEASHNAAEHANFHASFLFLYLSSFAHMSIGPHQSPPVLTRCATLKSKKVNMKAGMLIALLLEVSEIRLRHRFRHFNSECGIIVES